WQCPPQGRDPAALGAVAGLGGACQRDVSSRAGPHQCPGGSSPQPWNRRQTPTGRNSMSGTPHHQGREPLLVAEQVRKVYRTGEIEVEALVGLDLAVHRGELVAVMRPRGPGNTTLLTCPPNRRAEGRRYFGKEPLVMSLQTSLVVAAVGVAAALAWAPEPPGPHRAYVQRRRRVRTPPRGPPRRSRAAAD